MENAGRRKKYLTKGTVSLTQAAHKLASDRALVRYWSTFMTKVTAHIDPSGYVIASANIGGRTIRVCGGKAHRVYAEILKAIVHANEISGVVDVDDVLRARLRARDDLPDDDFPLDELGASSS